MFGQQEGLHALRFNKENPEEVITVAAINPIKPTQWCRIAELQPSAYANISRDL